MQNEPVGVNATGGLLKYRTDIDGIRAIAVMAVVIFHAGIERLSGGFLGVDIFYVISGFLITSIIQHEISANSFTLAGFYRRRIVRILPALFAMLAATLAFACAFSMPPDISGTGWASAAAAGFVSNFHFWQTTGYFDDAAQSAPLLHTWSLGVEEQFYILYPLLLMALARWRRNPKYALVAISLISIALALWFATWRDNSDFYLLPARAWQLGLGGLIAMGLFPKVRAGAATGIAAAGLAAIMISFFVVEPDWTLSGLLPTVGATLLIAYGEGSIVHRLLALPPMRWIGAISYSLYLWHWPIITFYTQSFGLDLDIKAEILLIAASILVAAISYYLIEQPMLRHYRQANPKKAVIIGAMAVAAMIGASVTVAKNPDIWRTVPADAKRVSAYANYADTPERIKQTRSHQCFMLRKEDVFDERACASIMPGKRNIVLIGDSHASQYWLALSRRYPQDNIMQVTGAGCALFPGVDDLERCREVNRFAYGPMLERGNIDRVILITRWTHHHLKLLKKTVKLFADHSIPVTVIGPTLEYETRFPIALGRAIELGDLHHIDGFRRGRIIEMDKRIRQIALDAGADYYSVIDAECPAGQCAYVNPADGVPLHFDYGHVTQSGAEYLLRDLKIP